jgi:dUTP pyrophosphatase
MQNTIFFSRTREVKMPTRGTTLSAGIDFFVPKFTEQFMGDFEDKNPNPGTSKFVLVDNSDNEHDSFLILKPNQRVLIPAGIKMNLQDKNRALIGFNKSGVASKLGLDVLACVIDSDYQGEIHINLVNTSNERVNIKENQKIIQFIEMPVILSTVEELPIEDLFTENTERGTGGFGSTDNK